jgi:hypothetical protein
MAVHRKAVALMDPIEAVARLSARASERAEAAQTRASGSASYDNGDGTRTVIGPQTGSATMATHVGDVTPPGRPLGVAGASSAGVVYVAWGGELEGGTPADFDHVSLYVSIAGTTELVGTLTEAGIVSTVPMATTATVDVWATAEDDACLADGTPAHNVSAESDHATVTVTQAEDKAAVDALRDRVSAVEAKADGLSTLIREDATGITVGKSADGKTYATGRTHMDEDSFDILDKAGNVLSSFGKSLIELGKNSANATISMFGGLATIAAQKFGVVSGIELSANGIGLQATSGGMNIHSHFPSTGRGGVGQVDVSTNLVSEEPMLGVWVADTTDAAEDGVSIGVTPFGVTTNHPEYLRSAIGSYGPVSPSSPYGSLTFCVRAGVATLWVSWGTTADAWATMQCGDWVVPEEYRPKFDLWCPVALENRGSGDTGDTVLVVEASTGVIRWSNRGGGHSAKIFNALVSWGIE